MKVPSASILVIDDEPNVVDILVTLLGQEGYQVLGALTSDEGLKLLVLSHPDLVVLDIALAGTVNGLFSLVDVAVCFAALPLTITLAENCSVAAAVLTVASALGIVCLVLYWRFAVSVIRLG